MSTAAASSTASNTSAQSVFAALNRRDEKQSSAMSETQNQFLTLLTTQLKNQDPLNPMDNAQMTSQLAQISTVDGIQKLNATLQTMLDNTSATQAMQAAALVGRGVLVPDNGLAWNGEIPAYGGVELAGPADRVTVSVKDANGLVVRTLELGGQGAGTAVFTWDGKTDNGSAAANGQYTFSVAAVQGTNKVDATALGVGIVDSVARTGTGVTFNVGTLGKFSLADIREVM